MTGRTWAPRQISRTHPVEIHTADKTAQCSVLFQWSEQDPAAVVLVISDPFKGERVVEWRISRAVLAGAMLPGYGEWVGRGDVKVRALGGEVTIVLTSPEGEAALIIWGEVLLGFLRDAHDLVPGGSVEESAIYTAALDVELAALLDGAA